MKQFVAKKLFSLFKKNAISLPAILEVMGVVEYHLAKQMSPAGRALRRVQVKALKSAVNGGDTTIWTSVLFPAEILYPFGLQPLTLEVFGATLSVVGLSPHFLNIADSRSVPPSMCTFHRLMLGMSQDGILPAPRMVGATSSMCDGNIKSFALSAEDQHVPFLFLDVPHEPTPHAITYLKEQLIEVAAQLSASTDIAIAEAEWKKQAKRVNLQIAAKNAFFNNYAQRSGNLFRGFEIANFAFSCYYLLGGPLLEKLLTKLTHDAVHCTRPHKKYKTSELSTFAKRLMWLHIVPQYPTPLWDLTDNGVRAKIVCDEYSTTVLEPYDEDDFFGSVAERLIAHPSNGGIEKRIAHITTTAKKFKVDGIIHYSSWGCHQAAGNVAFVEKTLEDEGFPVLSLSGDATDSRNASVEQHRTRLEAFLECL
jgi:benzoyl-CoA reductase/2-hydroxyglutaryl-CoA dehydratase subunit BcrC/BadD/HgdB